MKKLVIFVSTLGLVSLVLLVLSKFYLNNFIHKSNIAILYIVMFVVLVCILLFVPGHINSLENALNKKTKQCITTRICYEKVNLETSTNLFYDFKKINRDYAELCNIRSQIIDSLIERYCSYVDLKSFYKALSFDLVIASDHKDMEILLNTALNNNLVEDVFKKIFSNELEKVMIKKDKKDADRLLSWARKELHIFNPFDLFTRELVSLKDIK